MSLNCCCWFGSVVLNACSSLLTNSNPTRQDNANAGLIQRSLKAIYTKITESQLSSLESSTTMHTTTSASFFEIYNERVYDLLSCDANDLAVREDANKGVYVEGLTERIVKNTSEAMEVLHCGMENRKVASTNMNR